ncbi:MP99 putative mitochondrial [Leptomonas seymouri]|uniref:MP99 putative mitochondrial n=1 Tax=Leptomonas seymouri TaxID=5684 RepID=A0A0N1HUJ3_LEPSE|nr:MP99 putative mitochondrial [Leptomonas seymouri]|eukprot:KPI83918.1 MP99 putative mitochondrial [Leptomonas seymouri]
MYAISRLLLYVGSASSSTGGGAHKDYRNSAKLSEAFHTVHQRSGLDFDHVVIDVPHLLHSVAYLARDLVGLERDRETVRIAQRQLQTVLLRRLPPRKSLALLFDGSEPLWQLERTRLFPGRRYDTKFYRSCASPMPYLLEETLRSAAMELRAPPPETVISGPATPGLSEGKISAYLLDLAARIVHPPTYPPNLCPAVKASDSICLVGAPELALLGLGMAPLKNITAMSLHHGELTCCSLQDTMAWLRLHHLLPPSTAAAVAGEAQSNGSTWSGATPTQQRLAAVRTDAVFLYLLTNGHSTTGLPQVMATPFADVWDAYMELNGSLQGTESEASAATADGENIDAPRFRSLLFDEEPLTQGHLDRPTLRLRVTALVKLLVRVYRNVAGVAASVPSSSKPTPHAATLLTLALQTHGLLCSGGVPSPGWSPTPDGNSSDSSSKSPAPLTGTVMLDKYPKLSVEQLLQHLSYLVSSAPATSQAGAPASTSLYLCPPRVRTFGLTGAEVLLMTATRAEHIHQLLPLYVRGHCLPAGVAESIVGTRNVHEALHKTQKALGRVVGQAQRELAVMAAAETTATTDNKADGANGGVDTHTTTAAAPAKASTAELAGPHPALTHLPSHLFVRTTGSSGPPPGWAYYGVHLGVKAEAMSVRYRLNTAEAGTSCVASGGELKE